LEPFLANKVKYITANLPYSDPNCCDGAKWLHKTTTKYSLMDQIEDFYFHVQGCSNFDLAGKHSAEFIDHKNFTKTEEGARLQQSIAAFNALHNKYANGEKIIESKCDVIIDAEPTTLIEIPEENRKELNVTLLKIKKPAIEEKYHCDDDDDDDEDEFPDFDVLKPPPLSHDDDIEERLRLLNAV